MADVSIDPSANTTAPGSALSNSAAPAPETSHYRKAYDAALPASQALLEEALIAVNIDVPTAITTSLGRLPQIMKFRELAAKALPDFDLMNFDQLEIYTQATGHAQALFSSASAPPEALVALNDRGITLRDLLYSDALALSKRELINGDKLSSFKANIGYKNLAFDLLGLAALLRSNWDTIASRTAILSSELDEAELIGEQLVNAVAVREQAPQVAAQQALQRQRNFTLFVNAYDQVRRAINYLRWNEDDVDEIAPSLYAGRASTRKKPDPAQPTPASGAGASPSPSPTAGGPAPPAGTPAHPTTPAPSPAAQITGMPSGNPFAAS